MDVRTYLTAIRKSWWIFVLAIILGGALGFTYSKRSTPVYAAHVSFNVAVSAGQSANVQSSDQFAQSKAVSYAALLSKDVTARTVIQDTGIRLTNGALSAEITGAADLNTTIITATVLDTSKARALRIVTSLGSTFPGVAADTEPEANRAIISLKVVDYPHVGAAPVLPRTKLNTVFGLAGGMVLGLLIAVLRFLRDTSVRTSADLESIGHAPVVGDIGYDSTARKAPLVLERQARSVRAEGYRQLRTNLQFVDATGALRVIVVTSSTESEGKSTTATNLALMFAETGRSVLLVGADLRRPRVAEYLGLESAVGLTNVLVGQLSLEESLQPWGVDGMYVLASGSVPPNPSELLGSTQMADLLAELRSRFELIIIDTPPLLPVTDAAVLAVHADGVVVVCRHGKTRRAQLATAVRALESVNARIVGTVLNMRPARGPESGQYGGYGYYEQGKPRRWYRPGLPGFLRRNRPLVSDIALSPTPPLIERITVPEHAVAPKSPDAPMRAVSFAERIGSPTDAALSAGAATAFQRRQRRSRGGRSMALIEAVETQPDLGARVPESPPAADVSDDHQVNGATNGHGTYVDDASEDFESAEQQAELSTRS